MLLRVTPDCVGRLSADIVVLVPPTLCLQNYQIKSLEIVWATQCNSINGEIGIRA